jgi:hypothetical protein
VSRVHDHIRLFSSGKERSRLSELTNDRTATAQRYVFSLLGISHERGDTVTRSE